MGFKNTSELSSNGLYNFFCTFCDQTKLEEYWNEQDQKYHIPIHFVRSTLDQYFEGYQFIPEDINLQIFHYDKDKQMFVAPAAIGFECRVVGVKFSSVEQTIDGDICIRVKTLNLDIPNKETGAKEILVMHPKNNKFFFQSYQIIQRTYTDRELYDFSDSLGFKIEHWVGQRPLSSAILYDRFVELLCKFDQNNYGYLQIAVDDGSDDFKTPDWQYEYRKVIDIKAQPVEISYDQPGSVHAQWTKNGYVFSLSMNHGVKKMPVDQFIENHVGKFLEELVLSPNNAENLQTSKDLSKSNKNCFSQSQDSFVFEQKANTEDLINPFQYTLPGNQLTDDKIKTGFQSLYKSAHDVFYWYYNDSGPLNTNFEVPKIEDKQGEAWYPVTTLKTLKELNQITESVFSKRFSNVALYSLHRFHDIDGKLYERAGGGLGDSCIPDFETITILSKEPEGITLNMNINVEVMVDNIRVDTTEFTLLKQNDYWVLDHWI